MAEVAASICGGDLRESVVDPCYAAQRSDDGCARLSHPSHRPTIPSGEKNVKDHLCAPNSIIAPIGPASNTAETLLALHRAAISRYYLLFGTIQLGTLALLRPAALSMCAAP